MAGSFPKKKRRTQEERSASTRRRLLVSAVDRIARLGLAEATVPAIVEKAGLTTGAVQHHFGSREDLLIAVVYAFAEKISQQGRPANLDALDLQDRISFISCQLWDALGSAEYIAVTEILLGLRSRKDVFPKIQKLMRTAERELDQYWMEAFANTGVPKSDIASARHIFQASLRGLALRGVFKQQPEKWAQERRLLNELFATFLGSKDKDAASRASSPNKRNKDR